MVVTDTVASNAAALLEGRGLAIGYGHRLVGEGIDIEVRPGEVLALLGPNGSGKTTLLKTLLGLLAPIRGEVVLEGRALGALTLRERGCTMAYVPQSHAGTFAFSVEDVVLMGRTARAGLLSAPSAHDRAVAHSALARLGLDGFRERAYTMISGGERQLVLIARALAQEPKVVVLDEPTASLDFGNQGRVLREMEALARSGLAVVFTTHDPNQALLHADRAILFGSGAVMGEGPVESLLTRETLQRLYGAPVQEIVSGSARAFLPS